MFKAFPSMQNMLQYFGVFPIITKCYKFELAHHLFCEIVISI
jgi:hypothetical protein